MIPAVAGGGCLGADHHFFVAANMIDAATLTSGIEAESSVALPRSVEVLAVPVTGRPLRASFGVVVKINFLSGYRPNCRAPPGRGFLRMLLVKGPYYSYFILS